MAIEFEEYMKVFGNESQAGIIAQIITFGPLNIKELSKMINKAESTTFEHIKKLVKLDYIELDNDECNLRAGKWYKIAQKTFDALRSVDNVDEAMAESTGEEKEKYFLGISRLIQAFSSWPRNIAYHAGKFMGEHAEELLNSDDPIKMVDKVVFTIPSISIKTKEEWVEFKKILDDFQKKILMFHAKDAPMTQFLSLISLPIPDIHPIEDKRHNSIQ